MVVKVWWFGARNGSRGGDLSGSRGGGWGGGCGDGLWWVVMQMDTGGT